MPRASKEKKRLHYDNGENIPYRPPKFERGGKRVSAPKSRKNPCRIGWG